MNAPTVDGLLRHARRFGPECVYETGVECDLDRDDLIRLRVGLGWTKTTPEVTVYAARLLLADGLLLSAVAARLKVEVRYLKKLLKEVGNPENRPSEPPAQAAKVRIARGVRVIHRPRALTARATTNANGAIR